MTAEEVLGVQNGDVDQVVVRLDYSTADILAGTAHSPQRWILLVPAAYSAAIWSGTAAFGAHLITVPLVLVAPFLWYLYLFALPHDTAAKARAANWIATLSADGLQVDSTAGVHVNIPWRAVRRLTVARRVIVLTHTEPSAAAEILPRGGLGVDEVTMIMRWAEQGGVTVSARN